MKTKLMYVAYDGTPFNTEKECITYEKSKGGYVVLYRDTNMSSVSQTFESESLVKRFIANRLHYCYKNNIVGYFKLIHNGKPVEFNSNELLELVPAHYKINGKEFDKIFQFVN